MIERRTTGVEKPHEHSACLTRVLNSETPDADNGPQIRFDNSEREIRFAMNNSFGFGGNNCSLVFGRA